MISADFTSFFNSTSIIQPPSNNIILLVYYNPKKRRIKTFERTCRDIKTEKAHKQDWDSTLATELK